MKDYEKPRREKEREGKRDRAAPEPLQPTFRYTRYNAKTPPSPLNRVLSADLFHEFCMTYFILIPSPHRSRHRLKDLQRTEQKDKHEAASTSLSSPCMLEQDDKEAINASITLADCPY